MTRDPLPPYKRIVADLRTKIEEGELVPGDQVSSASMLTASYGVSRNTALRALKVLRDEGLITVEPGWGSFVAGGPR